MRAKSTVALPPPADRTVNLTNCVFVCESQSISYPELGKTTTHSCVANHTPC
eukprot:COSAG02_NODE_13297_length_1413_cov_1.333333_1_plen_51_part_10